MSDDGFAPSGSARIFYQSSGHGHPVVFIHAGIADSRMWSPQFESVPSGYRYVRLDRRGFGQTGFDGGPFSHYDDVLAVMDHLSLEPSVLVGCSMGGTIAFEVTRVSPDRVKGLVLIGADAPGFEPVEEYQHPRWPDAVTAFSAGDMRRVAELDAEIWVVGVGRSRDAVDQSLIDLVMEMDLTPLRSEADRDEVRIRGELPDISQLDLPSLVVVGEHDLPDMRAHAEYLAHVLTGGPPLVVSGAAHLASLERPEVFNDRLVGFLATIYH